MHAAEDSTSTHMLMQDIQERAIVTYHADDWSTAKEFAKTCVQYFKMYLMRVSKKNE